MKYPKTKQVSIHAIIFCFAFLAFAHSAKPSTRIKYNFNYGWKVFVGDTAGAEKTGFDDSKWENVSLPYAWNEDDAFKKDIHHHSTGIAWYRKRFKVPVKQVGQKVFVEFEGVRQAAEIYLNGEFIGMHENGVMAFGFDLSGKIKPAPEENLIAVRVDNSWDYHEKATDTRFQWSDRNFNANYGGIPKNVYLHFANKLYQTLPLYSNLGTTGQYIYASNFDIAGKSATITAETQVKNESDKTVDFQYEVILKELDGTILKQMDGGVFSLESGKSDIIKTSSKVNGLNFWSWGYGYLYDISTILKINGKVVDSVSTRTGFRKTEFANGLIRLNNRVITMKGYAQRTSNEWPAVGMSVPPWMSDFSNQMMVDGNANLVRWMHVTPWKQDVESCDRVGLIQAMPAGDSEKDRAGRQWEHRTELMRDAIIYNRNNPSILFYESGNKGISEEHMQEMKDLRDKYDPHGGRAAGCREMLDSKVAEYGGEMLYVNKSNHMPVWAMEYMRDEGLRKYWDEYSPPFHKDGQGPLYKNNDASAYNRNQDSHAIECIVRWFDYWRERPGTGKLVSSGGVNIIFSDSNTHYRGAENYRRSGEVDPMRIPKDGFFAHQVMWDGWVDNEKHSAHILGHWNYEKGTTKNVYVVSTGEKTELFVNSQSKGFGKRDYDFLFTFEDIAWEPGEVKAVAYDSENNVLAETKKETAGKPNQILLTLHVGPDGLFADGSDMALVDVEVVDANGNRCPTSNAMLEFELEGPAEWKGGIAQGPDNYILSKNLPVECGINRVMFRSLTQPGKIKLSAKSNGIEPASIELNSKPIEVENGLSLHMPQFNLPCNLEFGPTVQKPSFKITRKNIAIINAEAGSNNPDAHLSFDGSQNTRWTNDGNLESGWIKYELEHEANVGEIALKLSGWRTRGYPIVVSAAGKDIFTGLTERNLGYFYITLEEPVKTKEISIRLFGETEYQDVFNIVEITGKLDKETQNDKNVQNVYNLNIVEVEVFEKL